MNGGHATPEAWASARARGVRPTDRAKMLHMREHGDVLVLEGPGLHDDIPCAISQSTALRLARCQLVEIDRPKPGKRPLARLTDGGATVASLIAAQQSPASSPCMFGWNRGSTETAAKWMRRLGWIQHGARVCDAIEFAGHDPRLGDGWWRVRRDLSGVAVCASVPNAGACVYMISWPDCPVRAGHVPAYVGKAKSVKQRVSAHIASAMYKAASARVGDYIAARQPWAGSWFASVLEWAPTCGDALHIEEAYIFEAKIVGEASPQDRYLERRYQLLNTTVPHAAPSWGRQCVWDAAYIRGGGHVRDAGFIGSEMYSKLEKRFPTPPIGLDPYAGDGTMLADGGEAA